MINTILSTDIMTDSIKACLGGFIIGLGFGAFAQASRFCLRSACIEFWAGVTHNRLGANVAVWLCVFGAALFGTQWLFVGEYLAQTEVRQLTNPGTLSGAIIGGVIFGVGMIMARGCASRLLILSGTGNLRALLAGLVVTIVAQASLSGVLSPLRIALSNISVVGPDVRNLMTYIPDASGIVLGAVTLALAIGLAVRLKLGWARVTMALLVGLMVTVGWAFTSALSGVSFVPVGVGSISFTGPAADTLMVLIATPSVPLTFSIGLVPGVFLGALLSSVIRREFQIQIFTEQTGTVRYVLGGALMGFGGMLAGGCAVGAGVTGGSVLSLTAWVALFCMWCGAGIYNRFQPA